MNIQHCLHRVKGCDNGIRFWEAGGEARQASYSAIYNDALLLLGGLQQSGLNPGQQLEIELDGIQAYITALWACWLGGMIPVVGAKGSFASLPEPANKPGKIHPMADGDTALLLYTSGTEAAPRCVALSGANLYEGGLATSIINRPGVSERYLSWLPLTHIFGLVAGHIVPLFNGFDHCLMHPRRTLSTPAAWLRACSEYGATVTCSSQAGLRQAAQQAGRLAVRRADKPSEPGSIDLSAVYICLTGGDSLQEQTLAGFERAVGPFGWKPNTLCPSYGMSEATMGICYNPPGAPRRIQYIQPDSIAIGNRLRFAEQGTTARGDAAAGGRELGDAMRGVAERSDIASGYIERLSLGILDACNEVQVRDQDGRPLPDEHLGIIHIRGSNICQGYLPPSDPPNPDAEGWLNSGDLGYFKEGWLTVLARHKDVLCHNGVNYIRTELERAAREASGLERLALVERGRDLVLCLCDAEAGQCHQAQAALAGLGLPVEIAQPDELPLTAKGTIDRLALEMLLEQGGAGAETPQTTSAADSAGSLAEATAMDIEGLPSGESPVPRLPRSMALLAGLWAKRLDIPAAGISADSDFILLGGDSLAFIDLACDIEESLGIYVEAEQLAEQPTLAGMCGLLGLGTTD